MYASVYLDSGSLVGGPVGPLSYGFIKLETLPSITSTWDYIWHNNPWFPHNQEYFDVSGSGGALFTIAENGGKLIIMRTHMDSQGDPVSTEAYIYSESGDSLKNLHIRINDYNSIVGLFAGNNQVFLMTVKFTDLANPNVSPTSGYLMFQKSIISLPVFNAALIRLGYLLPMQSGSIIQDFYITGMKTGTDPCKAAYPAAGAGFISFSRSSENCEPPYQLTIGTPII
jgi:hypothetical protein